MTHPILFRTLVLGFALSLPLLTTSALASPAPAHGPEVRAGDGAKRLPFQPIAAPTDGRQDHPATRHSKPSEASPGSPPARSEELVGAEHPSFGRGPRIERLGTNSPYIRKVDTYGFEINETIEFTETSWAELSFPLAEPIPMHSVSRIAVEPLNVDWEVSGPSSWQPNLNIFLSNNAHPVTSVNWGAGSISPGSGLSARFGFTRRHHGFNTDPTAQATHLIFRITATEVPGGDPGHATLFRASLSGMLHSGLFRLHVIHQDAEADNSHEFRFFDHPVSQISLTGSTTAGPYWIPIDPPIRLRGARYVQAQGYGVTVWFTNNRSLSSTLLKELILDDDTVLALDDVYVPSVGQSRPPPERFLGHHLSKHVSLGELSVLEERRAVALRLRATQQAAPGSPAPRSEYYQHGGDFWIHIARDMLQLRLLDAGPFLGTGYPQVPLPLHPSQLLERGQQVHRVAADSGYATIVAMEVPGPGAVRFSLHRADDEARPYSKAEFGSLFDPWDPDFTLLGALAVESVEVEPGRWVAFCGYRSPDEFDEPAGSFTSDTQKSLRVVGAFEPFGLDLPTAFGELDFALERRPVLLVPDFRTDGASALWQKLDGFDHRFTVTLQLYPRNISFADWHTHVNSGINQAIQDFRASPNASRPRGAAAAVDVVGFGLGGLMVRAHLDVAGPERWNGRIARLITVGSAHLGSVTADELTLISAYYAANPAFGAVGNLFILPAAQLGFEQPIIDLANGVTASLGPSRVPSHAIAGAGGSIVVGRAIDSGLTAAQYASGILGGIKSLIQLIIGEIYKWILLPDIPSLINYWDEKWGNTPHDLFASVPSAFGNLAPEATTRIPWDEATDQQAIQNTLAKDPRVESRIIELLLLPVSDSAWSNQGFPPVAASDIERISATGRLKLQATLTALYGLDGPGMMPRTSLHFSPSLVGPGASVSVTLEPDPDGSTADPIGSAVVIGPGVSSSASSPLSVNVLMPERAFGTMSAASVILFSDGSIETGYIPSISVPRPSIVEFDVQPKAVEFTRYDRQRVLAGFGRLPSGEWIALEAPIWPIRFQSMNTDIASVDEFTGLVQAGSLAGTTTVRVLAQGGPPLHVAVSNDLVSLCPADLTGSASPGSPSYGVPDDVVDAEDFFFFLQMFAAGDSRADLTGSVSPNSPNYGVPNGIVDADDFFYFLGRFAEGCL